MTVRDFNPNDAVSCLKMRAAAITAVFTGKISHADLHAHLTAYKPHDLIRISENGMSFVMDDHGTPVGFCTLRRKPPSIADLPFIYVRLDYLKRGIGAALMHHMETWVSRNWADITRIDIETVVPEYNRKFYERLGYEAVGPCEIVFPDRTVPALQLQKQMPWHREQCSKLHSIGELPGDD